MIDWDSLFIHYLWAFLLSELTSRFFLSNRQSATWLKGLLERAPLALFFRSLFNYSCYYWSYLSTCHSKSQRKKIEFLQGKCLETSETVAIKKVLQDKRYKNRELQIMRILDHPNVVSLKHCFYSSTDKDEVFLNLVLEYVPETVYRIAKHYSRMNQRMPLIFVKLYTYQVRSIIFFRVKKRWNFPN